jgi:hypothetical protein
LFWGFYVEYAFEDAGGVVAGEREMSYGYFVVWVGFCSIFEFFGCGEFFFVDCEFFE